MDFDYGIILLIGSECINWFNYVCVVCMPGAPTVVLANGILILWAGILTVLQLDMQEMNRFNWNTG